MKEKLFKALDQKEGEQFTEWANKFYDEKIKPLIQSSNVWHPAIRIQIAQRLLDDFGECVNGL